MSKKTLIIEVESKDEHFLRTLQTSSPFEAKLFHSRRFEGEIGITEALTILATVTIPVIAKVIIELLRARKQVRIKVDGIEISGLTENTTVGILEKLLVDRDDE